MPEAHSEGRISRPRQQRGKGSRLCKEYEDTIKEDVCDKGCCTPESETDNVKKENDKINEPEDNLPPLMHGKDMLDDAIKAEEIRRLASVLPGCGPECGHGILHLGKCRAFS